MSYTDDLLVSLNAKIEKLINSMQNQKDLKEIKEPLEEANQLKKFELQMQYPESFQEFETKQK